MSFQIAIDGPAGAGKSTIAKAVSQKLAYIYLDTGAMYRAMGLYLNSLGIDLSSEQEIEKAVATVNMEIFYKDGIQQVCVNGLNMTGKIRTEEAGMLASRTSGYGSVRKKLVSLQQKIAEVNDVVMDGRDIGTAVLPNAPLKIFLTASSRIRAERRYLELKQKGTMESLAEIEEDIIQRDCQDMTRKISPLIQAEDAVLVDTSSMTIDEAVAMIIQLAEKAGAGSGLQREAQ